MSTLLEIRDQLNQLDYLLYKKNNLRNFIDTPIDTLIMKESNLYRPIYPKKPIEPKKKTVLESIEPSNNNKRINFVSLILMLGIILFIGLLIFTIWRIRYISEFFKNPGTAWQNWLDTSWNNVEDIYDIENGWNLVEADWENKGVFVSWEFVKKIIDSNNTRFIIYSNDLLKWIEEKYSHKYEIFIYVSCFAIPTLIYFLIKLLIIKKKRNENYKTKYEKYVEVKTKNEKANYYNQNVYPTLLEKYENDVEEYVSKCKELDEEYKSKYDIERKIYLEEKEDANIELKKLNTEISKYKDLISENYYDSLYYIVQIIDNGRADSLKEAINIFHQDSHELELINEQRRKNKILEEDLQSRRSQEAEHYKYMESIAAKNERINRENLDAQRKYNEEITRHNRELENSERERNKQLERNAKIAAMCQGCVHIAYCNHLGKYESDCNSHLNR